MASYVQNKQAADSHVFLIGTPLVLISIFCFGYIMMQSRPSIKSSPISASKTSSSADSQVKLLPPTNYVAQPKLDAVNTENANDIAVSPPQSTSESSVQTPNQTDSLQPAAPNHGNGSSANKNNSSNIVKTIVNKIL